MLEQLNLFAATNIDYEEKRNEEKRFEQKTKLSVRQWNLYNLIKHNSLVEHRKTTQREIYECVLGYEWNSDEKCHDHCPAIWQDITENNLSYEHDKIIISDKFTYWIGNSKETQEFIDNLWSQLAPRLMRYWFYKSKVARDGQGKLFDKNLNPVEDTKAREFIESYNPFGVEIKNYE